MNYQETTDWTHPLATRAQPLHSGPATISPSDRATDGEPSPTVDATDGVPSKLDRFIHAHPWLTVSLAVTVGAAMGIGSRRATDADGPGLGGVLSTIAKPVVRGVIGSVATKWLARFV